MNLIKGMERFMIDLKEAKQPSTIRRYSYDLKQFDQWLKEERNTSDSDIPTLEELHSYYLYLKHVMEYSPNTIRRILSVLKQWLLFMDNKELASCLEAYIQKTTGKGKDRKYPFLKEKDINRLFHSIASNSGLTDHQMKYRHLIRDRNDVIFRLILFYGVTIQELTNLTIDRIHFASDELVLKSRKGKIRHRTISKEDRIKLFEYYMTIPEPVRPGRYDHAPFFIAFDYQRGTYRWDYDHDIPKGLTEVAMQKMIRQEMVRAGLGRNLTARQLRKTYILNQLQAGRSKEDLSVELRFETVKPIETVEETWQKWESDKKLQTI
ncbi:MULTISPECIES: tyrosine-type recombinase/integrase [Bacillaceae]|uniref:Integrase n=1 Tax=Evansella alkalicola TaxID=745819 RepID=A0ABS6JVP9_9BACI|nr:MULTISPECIES: site-specific integrase [Bacillaceae]MBU9722657.1 integrase [Bacillus alkalicola]